MPTIEFYRDTSNAPMPVLAFGTTDVLVYTGTADETAAFVGSHIVRIVSTEDCFVAIGASATATSSDAFLPGGVVEYLPVANGERVSVVQEDTGGNAYVTTMVKPT
jgi:hypothetical protein